MTDDADRLNGITARLRDAGYELWFYESTPGARERSGTNTSNEPRAVHSAAGNAL